MHRTPNDPETYQVGNGNGTAQGASESAAIAGFQQLLLADGACSASYTDQTPGWQPTPLGAGSESQGTEGGGYTTPGYSLTYVLSTETSQIQWPLVWTYTASTSNGCMYQNLIARTYVERTGRAFCPSGPIPGGGVFNSNIDTTPQDAYCYRPGTTVDPQKNLGPSCNACTKSSGSSLSSSATSNAKGNAVGDPVNPGTGNNVLVESDYVGQGPMPLGFVRYYNSQLWYGNTGKPVNAILFLSTLGANWRSSYDRSITFSNSSDFPTVFTARPDGSTFYFKQKNGQWVADADSPDRLVQLVNGSGNTTGGSTHRRQTMRSRRTTPPEYSLR